jgi:uncharacterized protein (DUF608 family)
MGAVMADGLSYGRVFEGDALTQIAMPMGGIGAGCVCLNGIGGLQDFSIRHKPALSAGADTFQMQDGGFAVLRVKGLEGGTRLCEGPVPDGRIYDQGLKGQGYRMAGHEGLPRFSGCSFRGAYPFGEVRLSDEGMPVKVRVTGWSPFVPLDDVASGIPCAMLEYEVENVSGGAIEFEFSYHLSHLAKGALGWKGTRNKVVPGLGVSFFNVEPAGSAGFGSASLSVVGHAAAVKGMWLRSGWFDWISALWQEVSSGAFRENAGNEERELEGHNGGSVLVRGRLEAGKSVTVPIVIAWHFPNVHYDANVVADPLAVACCTGGECAEPAPKWQPFYVTQWNDAEEVGKYVRENYAALRGRTKGFADALFSSTLAAEVLDAVSSNLAILKSPTVLRQANGNVWGWEGCFPDKGCCSGTCTHVWNYAQAMPHLFPKLERGLREMELRRSMDEAGHIAFRAALPDGPAKHDFHPAADGQLGGIMKLYREWQIGGDFKWMAGLYPLAKRSLEFCTKRWDPEERGALFEPHHNTYDIEFWGPDGMCTSVYVGALAAMAEMGRAVGDEDAERYTEMAKKGAAFMDGELFNGEYFEQRVMWRELADQSFARSLLAEGKDEEELRILRAEGPKHQYGTGCLSDGVIGAWMARLYGIDAPFTGENVRRNLGAIFRHNFREDLSAHACTQRPGYAMGSESGLLLCSWPRGRRPTLPFVYSDEVWTGIEYQVASHLMLEGIVEEGLAIVRGVRGRYEGRVRNPFNEYECGNYYARAMASYALLASLSGFAYSAVTRELRLAPRVGGDGFRCFFSVATGFGVIVLEGKKLRVEMVEGFLDVGEVLVERGEARYRAGWKTKVKAGKVAELRLR